MFLLISSTCVQSNSSRCHLWSFCAREKVLPRQTWPQARHSSQGKCKKAFPVKWGDVPRPAHSGRWQEVSIVPALAPDCWADLGHLQPWVWILLGSICTGVWAACGSSEPWVRKLNVSVLCRRSWLLLCSTPQFLVKPYWDFSKPGSPCFVGQLLAGWIVLALLINYVTHRGWKEWNYRPGSAF